MCVFVCVCNVSIYIPNTPHSKWNLTVSEPPLEQADIFSVSSTYMIGIVGTIFRYLTTHPKKSKLYTFLIPHNIFNRNLT